MTKVILLFLGLLLFTFQVVAQTTENIKIEARKTPLNKVLLDLKDKYGLQFAFDNSLLSQYQVSVNRTFQTEKDALSFLVKNLPLKVEKSGDVFLIIPASAEESDPLPIRISGQVLEVNTHEPLPYSYVLINRNPVQSDQQGHFNFIASADTSYKLQISHLGYFIYDTIVDRSLTRQFFLTPQIERIEEITILSNPVDNSTLIGDLSGRMKINHQISPILPGHGDNSIFNLLRLMPGVLASGEQSNDLLIWGAYESHSKILFDGITLFGLKNFNDNIGVVNPFMVKNIEVLKGGYGARYGERVGGVVDIQGKDGTLLKPTFTFNINSTTVNGMVQVPVSKKSSLIGAYRQTYYQLYDPTNIKWFRKEKDKNSDDKNKDRGNGAQPSAPLVLEVEPDFIFRDANLKYTFKSDNGSRLSVSLYGGGDRFNYDMEGAYGKNVLSFGEREENQQFGGSLQYGQLWKRGDYTNINLSYSGFERKMSDNTWIENSRLDVIETRRKVESENRVNEMALNVEHSVNFLKGHKLLLGAGAINNQVKLLRHSLDEEVFDINNESPRIYAYLHDELPIGKVFKLKTGIRASYSIELKKYFIEPRASASLEIVDGVKVNAAWGLYNQFLSKTTVVDSANNYTRFWTNSDNSGVPVLSADHYVGGLSLDKNGFTFSSEAFYKTTDGLNRFFVGNKRTEQGFYEGHAKIRGVDVFLKKEYRKHMAWVSYTWCNAEENFPFYSSDGWRPSPHHQEHELKFAGIFNYRQFYLSASYVYGSGFERFAIETADGTKLDQPYRRFDTALVYKFKPGKMKAEVGISVLNVFNAQNIKYSNISVRSIDEINLVGIYADAVSFTPAVFCKIEL